MTTALAVIADALGGQTVEHLDRARHVLSELRVHSMDPVVLEDLRSAADAQRTAQTARADRAEADNDELRMELARLRADVFPTEQMVAVYRALAGTLIQMVDGGKPPSMDAISDLLAQIRAADPEVVGDE